MHRPAVTHPEALQTARWPALRCPACCGGGGSASWSCSTAWTGTAGSAPARRTPPGQQPATEHRKRPAETRRAPGRACRSVQRADALKSRQPRRWSLGHSRRVKSKHGRDSAADWCFSAAAVRSAGSWRKREEPLSPPPLPLSLLLYNSPPLCPHLSFFPFASLLLLLSPKLKDRFLLDEKSTAVKPLKAHEISG